MSLKVEAVPPRRQRHNYQLSLEPNSWTFYEDLELKIDMTKMNHPEDVAAAFQTAWNTHDMAAFRDLFHEDATFVNRFGHYVRGVDEIVALHAPIHQTIYRDSTL